MSADQATHFFLPRDSPIRVSDRRSVPKAGSLLLAPPHILREGRGNNGGPDGWVIVDRIIHESSAYRKSDRSEIVCSNLAQESGARGRASRFCASVT
jgi:hypothetical protein